MGKLTVSKNSKKVLLLVSFFFLFSIDVFCQNNSGSSAGQTVPVYSELNSSVSDSAAASSGSSQGTLNSEAQSSDSVPFYINNPQDSQTAEPSRFSTFFLFLRMILVLAFVIGCIYAVMWLMKRSMKTDPNNSDPFLRRVSSVDLLPGKSVHVVTLLDHAYLVGVSDSGVNLIGELDRENEKDKELINAMNLYADEHQNVKKPKSFADVLDIFMPGGPREKNGIFSDIQKKMGKNLRKQRNDLNGGEK